MGTEDFVFAENAKMCFFLVYGKLVTLVRARTSQ